MYKDKKNYLIKVILYNLFFDSNNAYDNNYPIYNELARRINRMVVIKSSNLFNTMQSLKKSNVIKFNDIYNKDNNNSLNKLSNEVIKVLYAYNNNEIIF